MIKFLISQKVGQDSRHGWRSWERRASWRISDHQVPLSIASMIGKAFENKLKESPGHEPSLRILENHYRWVSKNDKRLYEILVEVRKILNDRGEELDFEGKRSLAGLYMQNSEPAKAAMLYQKWNRYANSSRNTFRTGYLDEAYAWSVAKEKQKALKVLKKAEDDILKRNVAASAYNLGRMQRIYDAIGQPDKMVPLIKKAIKNGGQKYEIEKLQQMLRSVLAGADDRNDSEKIASAETEELLDPSQGFRAQAKYYMNRRSSIPTSLATNLTKAASNWHKAGEKKKASDALRSAEKALKTSDQSSRNLSRYYKEIAEVYLALEENQKALDSYLIAIENTNSSYEIKEINKTIVKLVESDVKLKIPQKMREFTDPTFATKREAADLEKRSKPGRFGYITAQINAAEKWLEAKEIENVKRCAARAADGIEQLEPSRFGSDETRWTQHEMHHQSLAELYTKAKMYPEAVSQLVKAMDRTASDFQAVIHHKKIKTICDQHGIEMPELSKATAMKLDPLNKHRVQARKYEARAKDDPEDLHNLKYAAKEWQEANEKEELHRVTDHWARMVRKKGKEDYMYEYHCKEIAEIYEELGELQKAIQYLEFARDAQEHEFMKKDFQKKIDRLRNSSDSH